MSQGFTQPPSPLATTAIPGISLRSTDAEALGGALTNKTLTPANLAYVGMFNGITPLSAMEYHSADDPIYVMKTTTDLNLTSVLSVGMRIRVTQATGGTKWFIIHAIDYNSTVASRTAITMNGGVDFNLENEAISSPAYSMMKVPYGFNPAINKWRLEAVVETEQSWASPNTAWKTITSLAIPIGEWKIRGYADAGFIANALTWDIVQVALSTSSSSATDNDLVDDSSMQLAVAGEQSIKGFSVEKIITLAAKTTYYLIIRQTGPTGGATCNYLFVEGQISTSIIEVIDAYL